MGTAATLRQAPTPAPSPRTAAARPRIERVLDSARQGQPELALLALQRQAGNAAVNALLAGRLRSVESEPRARLDAALREVRQDSPALGILEKGLLEARAVGIPVDLDGVRPPASALAVKTTGFGPGSVAPKRAAPPAKAIPKLNPLARAASLRTPARATPAPAMTARTTPAIPAVPKGLSADQLREPPVAPPGVRPEQDPAFTAVRDGVQESAKQARAHPAPTAKAAEAQSAAVAPVGDIGAQARAAKVDTMDAQQAGAFDKKAFITAVKAAIEAKSPRTLEEADAYRKSGKAGEVKGAVTGLVTAGVDGQSRDLDMATQAPPDESKAIPKPVTPMVTEPPAIVPGVASAGAVPKPAPPEQTNLQAGKYAAERELADGGVTEPQLLKSNEPDFEQAVADKRAAAIHADTAPGAFRGQEQQVLQQNRAEAAAGTAAALGGMTGAKKKAIAGLVAEKGKTKSADELKRAKVTADIQAIFTATETDVKAILDGIDAKVDAEFERGESGARAEFEAFVEARMSAYKRDRYGGWLGGWRWAKDKIFDMPDKVNEFYVAGRELYLRRMDRVITAVADLVGRELGRAKLRIAQGRSLIASHVKALPADLKRVGAQAAQEMAEKFGELESEVAAKEQATVDQLANKYVEARKGLDERIEALQEENKGLASKAIGAIKAVVNTIRELAAMLRTALARAAGVVGDIISNPIGFLGNLIAGVKGGILRFRDEILTHLRKGLMSWLFGALAEAGIELPETFEVKGIIKLLASIFGLTWANVRSRIVKRIGERAMGAIETGVEIFQKFRAEGVAGLWEMLLDKLGDIKEMILEKVKDFVITKIITAGITWLIGLLNPAAAFIKACKLIYDVVMFFVDNAQRISRFVNTVLDSVADIVRGNVGGVVAKINNVLGQMVPIIIGFLASAIGLGGIGQKIREIIGKLQKPVTKAIDFVIDKGLKLAGPILRGLKKAGGFVKAKYAAGKAWVKGKYAAGKAWLRGKSGAEEHTSDGPGGLSPSQVKAQAAEMLRGRSFNQAAEAEQAIATTWAALHPKGLKGLRFVPGSADTSAYVLASASPALRIMLAESPAEVMKIALSMRIFTGRTTAFVTYGGQRAFGPAGGFTNRRGGHAEKFIEARAPQLLKQIERERKKGVLPADQPTRIAIDINRLPCDHCVPRLEGAFQPGIDSGSISLSINAVSIWRAHTGGIDLTSDASFERLHKLTKGELKPLHIWPLIKAKMQSFGITEVQVGRHVYSIKEWLNMNADAHGTGAFDIEEKLTTFNAHRLKPTKVGTNV